MAIPQIIPNGALVRLLWSVNGELAINVFGARVGGTTNINQALAESLGSAIKSAYTVNLAANASTTTSLVRVGVRDMRVEHQPEFRDTGAPVTGQTTSDSLPGNVAICITLRTAQAGKSFRGRNYIGGLSEDANDPQGRIGAASASAAVAFVSAIRTAMTSNGLTLAVASRPSERTVVTETVFHNDGTSSTRTISTETAKAGSLTDVISVESRNNAWESQRRRNNGRGVGVLAALTPVAQARFDT